MLSTMTLSESAKQWFQMQMHVAINMAVYNFVQKVFISNVKCLLAENEKGLNVTYIPVIFLIQWWFLYLLTILLIWSRSVNHSDESGIENQC